MKSIPVPFDEADSLYFKTLCRFLLSCLVYLNIPRFVSKNLFCILKEALVIFITNQIFLLEVLFCVN